MRRLKDYLIHIGVAAFLIGAALHSWLQPRSSFGLQHPTFADLMMEIGVGLILLGFIFRIFIRPNAKALEQQSRTQWKRTLKFYKRFESEPFRVHAALRMDVRRFAVFLVFMLLCAGWWACDPRNPFPAFLLGIFFGASVIVFNIYAQTAKLWPLMKLILNWEKIDALLRDMDAQQDRKDN